MDKLYLGAAYYPEIWDGTEEDIARCRELGINTLRVGEFAWGKMEPAEGEFDFSWLLRVVDKLHGAGIRTVMCTPTATPPRWLLNKYPETRMVLHDSGRAEVSSRCHTCKTSPVMREKNRIITTELAKVFARHEGVAGWQLDNEIYPYSEGCYCAQCRAAFRAYLREKFGGVEKLNRAWGMARWSLSYDSFEDVEPPRPGQWRHPSLRKAWRDFQYGQIKTYLDEQGDILHRYGCKNVGTDMMPHNSLSYYQINEKLDVVQYNHYEPAGRLADTAFGYDFLRCVKDRPFWVTETQAGWNGSEFADCGYRPAGNCYVNTWLPFARGAQMNLYWHFRAHPNGHELAHGALFSPAGRACRVSEEVKRAGRELALCETFLTSTRVRSRIALHYGSTSLNVFDCAPLLKDFSYRETLLRKFYAAFRQYNVDVIDTPHDLAGYDVVLSPFLAVADENGLKERIMEWVNSGGTWIAGPMTDIMDAGVSRCTNGAYSFLEEFAGVYVRYQKPIANDVFRAQWADGGECGLGMCYDAFTCGSGTRSLAHYTEGEFAPYSVIAQRPAGRGQVILLGSVPSHDGLLRLVRQPPIAGASANVILTRRTGAMEGIIAIEAENRAGYVDLDGGYTELITGRTLSGRVPIAPYEVLVLAERG